VPHIALIQYEAQQSSASSFGLEMYQPDIELNEPNDLESVTDNEFKETLLTEERAEEDNFLDIVRQGQDKGAMAKRIGEGPLGRC
jgi:hypothetical protein